MREPGALAGLDPGRGKCGLVRTDALCRHVVEALVLPPEACFERLVLWHQRREITGLVVGNGTGSGEWTARWAHRLPLHLVDERGSTLEARQRYWELASPRGWQRLLPRGLRQPPRDVDDIVAQLLLERWLGDRLTRLPAP
ncbi:MAG: resolvase [Cyanobacteriota bacterium]|jgi:RNase H-fold protein (predicted Holliday junction resolvase)|nr:resolvase [Cyanobacteriota bacterium]